MKPIPLCFAIFICLLQNSNAIGKPNNTDSVYLFSYATLKNNSHNGLHFAWSKDGIQWNNIGNEYSFLKCDYGRWGSEKKMFSPFLFLGTDGLWHCIWSLNPKDPVFAHAATKDFIEWGRQTYPTITGGVNCLEPIIVFQQKDRRYSIVYRDSLQQFYQTTTTDFKGYTTTATKIAANQYLNPSVTVHLSGGDARGQVHRIAWSVVEQLIKTNQKKQEQQLLYSEHPNQDTERFKDLKSVSATITLNPQKAKPISDLLMGIFFEDINYAADGGLYAELIQNRDFEYTLSDKEGKDKNWNSTHSWMLKGSNASFSIEHADPIHANNENYALLTTVQPEAVLINTGYDGIAVKKGSTYQFSLFAKLIAGNSKKLQASLIDTNGKVLAQTVLQISTTNWEKLTAALTTNEENAHAQLELKPLGSGSIGIDMVSLFPQNTFMGHQNGLRSDLATVIANLQPRFVRFPGGCVAHGDGLDNIYRWKNTIGPLESRKPQRNLWGYHQTVGLGYFEYFQFCEDIGAQPVPVLAAGVPCQNSGTGGAGQQGGLPMQQMDEYIQDVLDLVEYANGDVNSKWGKMRAAAGHPTPFNLKYIGIGNEDLITDIFEERFTLIYRAMRKAHPEITVIGTVGPFYEGTDYVQGWGLANKLQIPMVDEHYYEQPGWFIHNQHFYDNYDRKKSKVYLGEYASWGNNFYNALAEALYLTDIERNADVVSMASYAPLLAKEKHTQWNTDLIYFNNTEVKPTVNYYIQQLYGQNAGNEYIPSKIALSENQEAVTKRVSVSVVRDAKNNKLVVKMVNLLPVAVKTTLDLKSMQLKNFNATKTVMSGNPTDKNIQPILSTIELTSQSNIELPPYSFTVLKF